MSESSADPTNPEARYRLLIEKYPEFPKVNYARYGLAFAGLQVAEKCFGWCPFCH